MTRGVVTGVTGRGALSLKTPAALSPSGRLTSSQGSGTGEVSTFRRKPVTTFSGLIVSRWGRSTTFSGLNVVGRAAGPLDGGWS